MSICAFSVPLFYIQLHHSIGDGIGVIATLGLLLPALKMPWEMCDGCGFSYVGTTLALPKGARVW